LNISNYVRTVYRNLYQQEIVRLRLNEIPVPDQPEDENEVESGEVQLNPNKKEKKRRRPGFCIRFNKE